MIAISLILAAMVAQATQTPVRDRAATVTAAPAAQVSGRVVTPENQPLRRAIVRLTSPALPAPRVVRTDPKDGTPSARFRQADSR